MPLPSRNLKAAIKENFTSKTGGAGITGRRQGSKSAETKWRKITKFSRGNGPNCFETGTRTYLSFANEVDGGLVLGLSLLGPLDSSFVSVSIAIKIATHHLWRESPGEQNLLRCEGQGFRRSQGIQLRWKPHVTQPLVSRPWPPALEGEPLTRHTHRYGPPMEQSAHRICKY